MLSRALWGPLSFLALTFVLTFVTLIRGVTACCERCNETVHDGE